MTKEAYYFSHDSNARNDIKIVRLRRSLGLEGYGIYFCLIEILREQAEHKLPIANIPDIAFEINTSEEKVKAVVLSFDLFCIDNDLFFSERLLRSMSEYNSMKSKFSNGGKKGNAIRWGTDRGAIGMGSGGGHPQIALKERKGKKRKGNENIVFIPPSLSEVEAYFSEKGYSKVAAKKAFDYYEAGNWSDSKGQKVKNWKQKMNGVWFKEENRATVEVSANRTAVGIRPEFGWVMFSDGSHKTVPQKEIEAIQANNELLKNYR